MCYDIAYLTQKKKKYAERHPDKDLEAIESYFDEKGNPIKPVFHTTGFDHPKLAVITLEKPDKFQLMEWGLIPSWVKDNDQALQMHNKTINARGESIFEKPAFRKAAADKRCIVMVDGFFEHQHRKKEQIPHYISLKDNQPMSLAGIYEEWINPENGLKKQTISIVTTQANPMMAEIHNSPKLKEPRMPLILPKELEEEWLISIHDKVSKEQVEALIKPYDEKFMQAWPVKAVRGKKNRPQTHDIIEPHEYGEQLGLF